MLRQFLFLLFFSCTSLFTNPFMAIGAESSSQRATRILNQIDDMWRGKSSSGTMSMRVKTEHYTRAMSMKVWSKGKDRTLVRIVSPLKEKGSATLKSGTSIYTYLPKTDRTIRLTSGMMMNSWMGSHFTNDDLVKESRLVEDYNYSITFEGKRGREKILEFTLLPKPDAAVVWGKIVLTARAGDYVPLKQVYYDEDMDEIRVMVFSMVKNLGDRMIPSVLRMEPRDKPGEFTEIVYEDMEFDLELGDYFFSLMKLKRKN